MSRLILTSFTELDAGGGVPRWNRDIVHFFPKTIHYSWENLLNAHGGKDVKMPEWERAKTLNKWLLSKKAVIKDDIVLSDGFWANGLFPERTVSIAHGMWSHLTKEDLDAGIKPEFPISSTYQNEFWQKHIARGGRIVAVSNFVAEQLFLQLGLIVPVIGNAIDIDKFHSRSRIVKHSRPLIIHACTNKNKGFDHIEAVKNAVNADVLLLDEAVKFFCLSKYEVLAQADLVVHPSAYEGNSYFLLESLASGVPIVAYDVGLMHEVPRERRIGYLGTILDRKLRSPRLTAEAAVAILAEPNNLTHISAGAREFAEKHSIQQFFHQWKEYFKKEFGLCEF